MTATCLCRGILIAVHAVEDTLRCIYHKLRRVIAAMQLFCQPETLPLGMLVSINSQEALAHVYHRLTRSGSSSIVHDRPEHIASASSSTLSTCFYPLSCRGVSHGRVSMGLATRYLALTQPLSPLVWVGLKTLCLLLRTAYSFKVVASLKACAFVVRIVKGTPRQVASLYIAAAMPLSLQLRLSLRVFPSAPEYDGQSANSNMKTRKNENKQDKKSNDSMQCSALDLACLLHITCSPRGTPFPPKVDHRTLISSTRGLVDMQDNGMTSHG